MRQDQPHFAGHEPSHAKLLQSLIGPEQRTLRRQTAYGNRLVAHDQGERRWVVTESTDLAIQNGLGSGTDKHGNIAVRHLVGNENLDRRAADAAKVLLNLLGRESFQRHRTCCGATAPFPLRVNHTIESLGREHQAALRPTVFYQGDRPCRRGQRREPKTQAGQDGPMTRRAGPRKDLAFGHNQMSPHAVQELTTAAVGFPAILDSGIANVRASGVFSRESGLPLVALRASTMQDSIDGNPLASHGSQVLL